MRNFRTGFVAQFLSPKVMRDFRLFAILDDDKDTKLKVSAIHDEAGYRRVREILSDNYNLGSRRPNLRVWNVDLRGDRSPHPAPPGLPAPASGRRLSGGARHVAHLWGFDVRLEVAQEDGSVTCLDECRRERRKTTTPKAEHCARTSRPSAPAAIKNVWMSAVDFHQILGVRARRQRRRDQARLPAAGHALHPDRNPDPRPTTSSAAGRPSSA